jgi:Leucine-rich repeat (LRR) protein
LEPDTDDDVAKPGFTIVKGADTRISRKMSQGRATSPISPLMAVAGTPSLLEPGLDDDVVKPGFTIVKGADTRISRKMSQGRKMSSQQCAVDSSGLVAAAGDMETFDDEPDQLLPGTAVASSNDRESRIACKIAQASGVGAVASTDDSKIQSKSRSGRLRTSALGTSRSKIGAVQTTGDDPARQKSSWISDSLFKTEEGQEINADDYLRQQVSATKEAQKDKLKNKEDKLHEGVQKDGDSAVPKLPGAFSVKGGRGWFTGGFRQRARNALRREKSEIVQDGDIEMALQDEIDEEITFWEKVDKPTLFVGVCILVFLSIAIAIPISLVASKGAPETPAPTSSRYFLYDDFKGVFTANVSDQLGFRNPKSAESLALEWIVLNDTLALSLDDSSLIQRYILMVIYYGNGGDGWDFPKPSKPWGSGIPECEWDYVACTDDDEVSGLSLLGVGLVGKLQSAMVHLTKLTSLDLAKNELNEVEFPTLLLNMTNLQYLYIDENDLRGSIPSEISVLSKLQHLYLGSNDFTGPLPIEMRTMRELTAFQGEINRFEGNLFDITIGWPKLSSLEIGNNRFTGIIPSQIGLQRNMTKLRMDLNDLEGTLPTELGNLVELKTLIASLQSMGLQGTIPSELGNCSNLQVLQLDSNRFTGSIPTQFGKFGAAVDIRLGQNDLTGVIPSELGLCTNLLQLSLSNNQLFDQVPTQLGNLSLLTQLYLSFNDITGSVPQEVCSLRGQNLQELNADCFDVNAEIKCKKPQCCTQCT